MPKFLQQKNRIGDILGLENPVAEGNYFHLGLGVFFEELLVGEEDFIDEVDEEAVDLFCEQMEDCFEVFPPFDRRNGLQGASPHCLVLVVVVLPDGLPDLFVLGVFEEELVHDAADCFPGLGVLVLVEENDFAAG